MNTKVYIVFCPITYYMSTNKEKNREIINITLDETKSTVKKTTDEAIKEIPRFTKAVNEYQEESIITDSTIASTRLANNVLFTTMETWKTSIQHTRDNAKEFSRLNANVAKTFENVAKDSLRDFSPREVQTHSRQ